MSHLRNGGYGKSFEIFKKISDDNTHEFFVQSFFQLGINQFEQKKWDKAIEYWKEYIKREDPRTNKSKIVEAKFLIANTYETTEKLREAYDIYYSLQGEYPNNEVIKNRLQSIYQRRINRKR
jgi:tetratricopeptide (TPR) repeat protein